MLSLLAGIFMVVGNSLAKPTGVSLRKCPPNFDFASDGSCFKYVNTKMFQHSSAEQYCKDEWKGELAKLDSKHKIKSALKYFYSVFHEEAKSGGVPTAWVQGQWVRNTRHVVYDNGVVNVKPHWMTSSRHQITGESLHWPTHSLFGWDATCISLSLWQPKSPSMGIEERAGVYNVPCDSFYWANVLCEVKM